MLLRDLEIPMGQVLLLYETLGDKHLSKLVTHSTWSLSAGLCLANTKKEIKKETKNFQNLKSSLKS